MIRSRSTVILDAPAVFSCSAANFALAVHSQAEDLLYIDRNMKLFVLSALLRNSSM